MLVFQTLSAAAAEASEATRPLSAYLDPFHAIVADTLTVSLVTCQT